MVRCALMQFERRTFEHPTKQRPVRRRVIAFVVFVCVLLWWWYRSSLGAVDPSSEVRIPLTVPSGAHLGTIATDLEEKDVIHSSLVFTIHARLARKDRLVRAGMYVLQPSMSVDEILTVLTGGAQGEVSVTIPEGFTVADIDTLMAKKGFTATGAIIECAAQCDFSAFSFLPDVSGGGRGGSIEGYLYPDTYFIGGEGSDPHAFLSRLLTTFEKKVVQGLSGEIAASGTSLEEIVIMASLIEKEAANDQERPMIAGILWKRLDIGMILGVDAAVRYAVGKTTEPLTSADLQSDSPYNIRTRKGLPPGPIANPGLASIRAALKPEASPYFYYLHGTDGQIRYAVTNDEHNSNKAKYLR